MSRSPETLTNFPTPPANESPADDVATHPEELSVALPDEDSSEINDQANHGQISAIPEAVSDTSASRTIQAQPEATSPELEAGEAVRAKKVGKFQRFFNRIFKAEVVRSDVIDTKASDDSTVSPAEAAALMREQGFVEQAPNFAEQAQDASRTNIFRFEHSTRNLGKDPAREMYVEERTEQQGIIELRQFLTDFIQIADPKNSYDRRMIDDAEDILENMSFIGEKEYKIAVEGLARLWVDFLKENPRNILCVPTSIGEVYENTGKPKSDDYLFDQIIQAIDEEDFEALRSRIIKDPRRLEEASEHVKIIMLDDWTVSGSQMKDVYENFTHEDWFDRYGDRIEMNMIIASEDRIKHGFKTRHHHKLPIRAYYMSHPARHADYKHVSRVSGVHSSVDYDFENDIYEMRYRMEQVANHGKTSSYVSVLMPPLTNIVRPYRSYHLKATQDKDGNLTRKS